MFEVKAIVCVLLLFLVTSVADAAKWGHRPCNGSTCDSQQAKSWPWAPTPLVVNPPAPAPSVVPAIDVNIDVPVAVEVADSAESAGPIRKLARAIRGRKHKPLARLVAASVRSVGWAVGCRR